MAVRAGQHGSPGGWMFINEIKSMMYSFGDVRHPSTDTAALIEDITHKQITDLIRRTNEVTQMREGKCVGVEDIYFLLRKDKSKLKCLLRHLSFKEVASSHEEEPVPQQDLFHHPGSLSAKKRHFLDFLNPVDLAGDFSVYGGTDVDEIQADRLEFQNSLTENMDQAQYLDYAECRQASFGKNMTKFKEWLNLGSLLQQQAPSRGVMEILGYLCYDTVRELVELALLVRKDMEDVTFGSMAHHSIEDLGPAGCGEKTAHHISPHVPGKSSRKRQREGDEDAIGDSLTKQDKQVVCVGLQPVHIREAFRRQNMTIGPLVPFATHFSRLSFTQRTLCV